MKSIGLFPSSPSLTQQVHFGELLKPGGSECRPVTRVLLDVDFFQRAGSTSKMASLICMDNGPRNYVPSKNHGPAGRH